MASNGLSLGVRLGEACQWSTGRFWEQSTVAAGEKKSGKSRMEAIHVIFTVEKKWVCSVHMCMYVYIYTYIQVYKNIIKIK